MDPDSVKYLKELIDDDFQATLQKEVLKNAKWKRLINQKKMAVGVVDLWVQKPRPLSIQNRKL